MLDLGFQVLVMGVHSVHRRLQPMTKDHKNLEINIVDKLRKVFFSDVYTYDA